MRTQVQGKSPVTQQSTLLTQKSLPTNSPLVPSHSILNDTSFAVLDSAKGYRHLFFQDSNNTLRQIVGPSSASQARGNASYWNAFNAVVAEDARSHTPLCVLDRNETIVSLEQGSRDGNCLLAQFLLYVNNNDHLVVRSYDYNNSSEFNVLTVQWKSEPWATETNALLINPGELLIQNTSRSLSISYVPGTNNSEMLIAAETTENVVILHGIPSGKDASGFWDWRDVSRQFINGVSEFHSELNGILKPPFSLGNVIWTDSPELTVISNLRGAGGYNTVMAVFSNSNFSTSV